IDAETIKRTVGKTIVDIKRIGLVGNAAKADIGDWLAYLAIRVIGQQRQVFVESKGTLEFPTLGIFIDKKRRRKSSGFSRFALGEQRVVIAVCNRNILLNDIVVGKRCGQTP